MVKRILDCTAKDFMSMTKDEILESDRKSTRLNCIQ